MTTRAAYLQERQARRLELMDDALTAADTLVRTMRERLGALPELALCVVRYESARKALVAFESVRVPFSTRGDE